MSSPLLGVDQEWHRQRAQLRAGHQRPPPLVTAGLELGEAAPGVAAQVRVVGMALVFGMFPPSLAEFIELARSRLRLGEAGEARNELKAVLHTRIQALWAWLPTLRQDCYCEFDHATGEARLWLIGPRQECCGIAFEAGDTVLDEAFLAALLMCGHRYWAGIGGLPRLIERFGRRPLLTATEIGECLDKQYEPTPALEAARRQWPQLSTRDDAAWLELRETCAPWALIQCGRLALRVGRVDAARQLLRLGLSELGGGDAPTMAWFDLGRAAHTLGDLIEAEHAFANHVRFHADHARGWRRLLLVRARLGLRWEAKEAFDRYHAVGGTDAELAERLVDQLRRADVPVAQRGQLASWVGAWIAPALAAHLSLTSLQATIADRLLDHVDGPVRARAVDAGVAALRSALMTTAPDARGETIDALVRTVLLTLPLLAGNPVADAASHAQNACTAAAEHLLGMDAHCATPALHEALAMLVTACRFPSGA